MTKVPTAEEFFKPHRNQEGYYGFRHIESLMIEFAKLHVKAALEAAAIKSFDTNNHFIERDVEDKESILNSYPLTNIK